MSIQYRRGALLLSFAAVLSLGSLRLAAQVPKADPPAEPAKKAFDPSRRVPAYFGQIGLTLEQREAIYGLNGKHQAKIAELQKQIAKIRLEMLAESEIQLTPPQKELLANLRRVADERKKARAQSLENAASSKPAEKKGG